MAGYRAGALVRRFERREGVRNKKIRRVAFPDPVLVFHVQGLGTFAGEQIQTPAQFIGKY